ncbi:MAG: hypothetical protein WDZ52_11980 [Pseudohongiellaceae bacterium]
MAGIADAFDRVDPREPGFARIGRFLQNWALVEGTLRQAIGKALGLSRVQTVFVGVNLSFRDKINTLKTAIDVSHIYPEADKDRFKKLLDTISGHSPVRNMVAHDMFEVSEDGSKVSFFVIKAKGKFDLPDVTWDERKFREEYALLVSWCDAVHEIIGGLDTQALVKALLSPSGTAPDTPMGALFGLGSEALRNLPPEASQRSSPLPSSEETDPQTPQEPQT